MIIIYQMLLYIKKKRQEEKPKLPEFSGTEYLIRPKKAEIKKPSLTPKISETTPPKSITHTILRFTPIPGYLFKKEGEGRKKIVSLRQKKEVSKGVDVGLALFVGVAFLLILLPILFLIFLKREEQRKRSIKAKAATIIYEATSPSPQKQKITAIPTPIPPEAREYIALSPTTIKGATPTSVISETVELITTESLSEGARQLPESGDIRQSLFLILSMTFLITLALVL